MTVNQTPATTPRTLTRSCGAGGRWLQVDVEQFEFSRSAHRKSHRRATAESAPMPERPQDPTPPRSARHASDEHQYEGRVRLRVLADGALGVTNEGRALLLVKR